MIGHVEIMQTYDGDYYYVFVDGKPAIMDKEYESHQIYKEDWAKVILKNKIKKAIAAIAGVNPEQLTYSFYDIFWGVAEKGDEIDGDDCAEYSHVTSLIAKYKIKPEFHQQAIEYIENNY